MTYRIWRLFGPNAQSDCVSSEGTGQTPLQALRSLEDLPSVSLTTGRYLVARIDPGSWGNHGCCGIFEIEQQPPVPATLAIREVTP